MKTVYIPKGEIVRYESLMTEHLVVHGCLQVSNGIKARTITGQGTISAGTIDADVIRVDDVEAGSIVCKRLLAKRVQSPEVFASESAAVSCFLSAAYVETGRLTVTLSEIDEVKAEARKAYLALNCAGLSRCDFFVERGTGRVLCNELNTLPGFTPISMYPKLMEHEGYSYPALVDKLLQLALHRRKGAY